MTPGRGNSLRKRDLVDLVFGLRDAGWTPLEIGEGIGYSQQQVRNILRDHAYSRPTLEQRMASLPAQLQRKVSAWREFYTFSKDSTPSAA